MTSTGGRPPAAARAGAATVVFDGTLADRHALWATLTDRPAPAEDADLLAAAYERLGRGLLSRISGQFALVVWDPQEGTLLCVRDPIGIHPLLYSITESTVVVGSYLEPILQHPAVPVDVDRVAVSARILEYPLQPEETFFTSVRRLPPGHALEVAPTSSRIFRYWDPGEPGSERGLSIGDAADDFESLMSRAVARSLADGPAAVFLSGGIDSALVATVTTRSSRAKGLSDPLALALMVDAPDVDEAANQRAIASDLALELVSASLEETSGPLGLLRATLAVSASGSPGPADIIQPVYDHLARLGLERGRSTFLNGQGGDEWLLPPPLYAADRLRAVDLRSVWHLWAAWFGHYPRASNLSAARFYLWTWGVRPFVRESALRLERSAPRLRRRRARLMIGRIPGWLAPEAGLRRDLVERMLAATESVGDLGSLAQTARRGLLDRPDRPGITEDAFALRRRVGVRLDMPLLDADVLRFLYRLPPDLLVHHGRAKALGRAVVSEHLPTFDGRWPRTISGDPFYRPLVNRESVGAWRHAGGTPFLVEAAIVDGAALARRVASGPSPAWLWPATNVDVWLRGRFGDVPLGEA